MDRIDYYIKFVLFQLFFWLWGAPLVVLIAIFPAGIDDSTPTQLLRLGLLLAFIGWFFLGASWLARRAAQRSAYEYDSPLQAIRFAVGEARLYLSFLPVIGPRLAPKPTAEHSPVQPE